MELGILVEIGGRFAEWRQSDGDRTLLFDIEVGLEGLAQGVIGAQGVGRKFATELESFWSDSMGV